MVKFNKNSYTLKLLRCIKKGLIKYKALAFNCGEEVMHDCSDRPALSIAFLCFILFALSFLAYGTSDKTFATVLLIIYSVCIFLAMLRDKLSAVGAICIFIIPIFICSSVVLAEPASAQTKCSKVKKKLEAPDDYDYAYLKYWYKNNCGGN